MLILNSRSFIITAITKIEKNNFSVLYQWIVSLKLRSKFYWKWISLGIFYPFSAKLLDFCQGAPAYLQNIYWCSVDLYFTILWNTRFIVIQPYWSMQESILTISCNNNFSTKPDIVKSPFHFCGVTWLAFLCIFDATKRWNQCWNWCWQMTVSDEFISKWGIYSTTFPDFSRPLLNIVQVFQNCYYGTMKS